LFIGFDDSPVFRVVGEVCDLDPTTTRGASFVVGVIPEDGGVYYAV
jgi:hypothetical protein